MDCVVFFVIAVVVVVVVVVVEFFFSFFFHIKLIRFLLPSNVFFAVGEFDQGKTHT